MAEHGKPEVDDWIVYGNFSEFSEEVVEELLTRHPDIEAIVCANDQMAVGAYNVLKKMNKVPGKDILITGFDDSPTAMILDPNLASVKADTKELAYLAVLECLNVMKGEVVNKYVKSRLILRESCGSDATAVTEFTQEGDDVKGDASFAKRLAGEVFENYFNNYFDSAETLRMKQLVADYFEYFLHMVDEKGSLSLDHSEFVQQYMRFSETYNAGYVNLNLFLSLNYLLYGYVSKWIDREEERLRLMEEMSLVNQEFMNTATKQRMVSGQKANVFEIVLTNITRDMLQFSSSETKRYNSVLTKFQKMDFASGYLLGYGEGILNRPEDSWKQPETLYMKGYYNNDNEVHLYEGKDCPIPSRGLFRSDIMPSDRRFDMLVMPLFSGEHLFGLMLTESAFEYFQYATQIACQVSVSVEVIEIIKRQNAIKAELEKNLVKMEENNRVLDQMSRSDTLTGISNRRGFLDKVKRIIEDENNYGQRAVAVYADMDCLKIVNDEFGHDEGDFALKTIATALSESFRQSDVVARMGGDEFAAFAIVNHDNFSETLRERIQEILAKLNENDKPYYVNMSIGTHEFIIDADTNLNHVLNAADENLYLEKKNKVKVVYKNK
jgi:diguanylate cyclase (GGDEF)-like protein